MNTRLNPTNLAEDESGMATLEALPLLFIFVFLTAYTLGFFGVIHTAIMNSIGARAYAFETFRNRTNLVYFRDNVLPDGQFKKMHSRLHAIMTENRKDNQPRAVERPIRIGVPLQPGPSRNDISLHNEKIYSEQGLQDGKRNQKIESSPVWLMVQYGICIDSNCGPD